MPLVMFLALLIKGYESWIGYALIALLVVFTVVMWLAPSRAKAMAALASHLKMRYEPIMSRAELGIRGTTFDVGYPGENCMRGMIAGLDTVIFDKTILIEPASRPSSDHATCEQTIIGFHVSPDTFCRDRGILQPSDWHVEKLGEWVFVYGRTGLVKPKQIPAYVDEARGWFERSTEPKGQGPTLLS